MNRILNVSGIAAPLVFVVAVAVAGALHPNYSHLSPPISLLAARGSPCRDLMTYAGLIPTGVLTVLFSIAVIRRGIGSPGAVWSGAFLTVMGVARLLAAVFPCDPGCASALSVSARLHVLAFSVATLAGSLSPLAMALELRSRRPRRMWLVSLGLGVGALAGFTLLRVSMSVPALRPYLGLFQRLTVGMTLIWMILLAITRPGSRERKSREHV